MNYRDIADKRKGIVILFSLVCLFLVFRLLVLFTYSNRLYELEELYRGTVAREIIHGPLIPLWEYLDFKVEYFPGGTLVAGILAVPFFLLFGETYFSLKLVGLLFALGAFILWYLFLDKFFSRRTAVVTALIFIFCAPFYTMSSLITWGAHPEANFFTILSLYLFYNIFFISREKKALWFLALGLVSGFGVWFVQTYLVTVIFILGFWYVFDKNFFRGKDFFAFVCGCVIGFSPAFYYAFSYDRDIWAINGKSLFSDLLACDLNVIIPKALKLFGSDLPNSFLFANFLNVGGRVFSYLYYSLFISAFIYLIWNHRKDIMKIIAGIIYPLTLKEAGVSPGMLSRESIILVYPLFFFLCYLFSSYSILPLPWEDPRVWPHYIGYRYMIPLMPFILAVLGMFLAKMRAKAVFWMFAVLILGLGFLGNLNIISFKNFGGFLSDRGYSYNIIGDKIGLRISEGLKEYISPFNNLELKYRREFYDGLGSGIAWRLRDKNPDEIINVFNMEINKEYHPYLYRGWGALFSPDYPEEFARSVFIAGNMIAPEYKPFFYEGFGRNMYFFEGLKMTRKFLSEVEQMYRPYCYKGLGYSIGFELRNDLVEQSRLLDEMDEDSRAFVQEGTLKGIASR